jgi:hypothetical protein
MTFITTTFEDLTGTEKTWGDWADADTSPSQLTSNVMAWRSALTWRNSYTWRGSYRTSIFNKSTTASTFTDTQSLS